MNISQNKKFRFYGTFSIEYANPFGILKVHKNTNLYESVIIANNETDALKYALKDYAKYINKNFVYFLDSYSIKEIK